MDTDIALWRRASTEAIAYIAAQAAGAVAGALLLLAPWPEAPADLSAMNPARSLGPALAAGKWQGFWIYLVGPAVGASLGALAYQTVRGTAIQPAPS